MEVLWRAKRKDNGEYQIGDLELNRVIGKYFIKYYDEVHKIYLLVEIDKDTRALNFEDMIDSDGNKIFASLSKDGRGGDIVTSCFNKNYTFICIFHFKRGVYMTLTDKFLPTSIDYNHMVVTGIKQ